MCSTIDKNFLHPRACEELEGIFDQRRIGEREKTLTVVISIVLGIQGGRRTLGFSRVNGLKRVSKESAKT